MKKIVFVLCAAVLLFAAAALGYFAGKKSADPVVTGTTFYAVIEEINGTSFLVDGLEINDINSRGEFYFTVDDQTVLEWRNTGIAISDLQVGDTIAVTYTGEVMETYPVRINDIIKLQLLDDEK